MDLGSGKEEFVFLSRTGTTIFEAVSKRRQSQYFSIRHQARIGQQSLFD